ncbi:MAG: hypothetical protein ABIS47_11700 [Acidimicrobiales bacterium]
MTVPWRGGSRGVTPSHLTTDELHHLATSQQIPGRSSMDRDELLATVAPA